MTRGRLQSQLFSAAAGLIASIVSAQAPSGFVPLGSAAIRQALIGGRISYDPPGSADMAIDEEFHSDGTWRGMQHGRGPIPFSGSWKIATNLLCVAAAPGSSTAAWLAGRYCRKIWHNAKTGELMIEYLRDQPSLRYKVGPQVFQVRNILSSK